MVRYDREKALTIATGIVSSEMSSTMPMMRIERTIVAAASAAMRYEIVRVGMPRLRANSRSKATYMTGRSQSSAPSRMRSVSHASASTSPRVTVTMLPNR